MLLFDPKCELHIIDRLRERVSKDINIPSLYSLLKLINDYLPDDWRFGIHSNEFLLRTEGKYSITFMGESYYSSSNPEKFIHLIKTALPTGGFVKGEIAPCDGEMGRLNAKRPNAYILFFDEIFAIEKIIRKNWFYPISPLVVRQYEKINPQQVGTHKYEYHRIHPLAKNGIVKEVFGWLRWSETGRVEFNPNITPESDWHGESYWKIEKNISKDEEKDLYKFFLEKIKLSH